MKKINFILAAFAAVFALSCNKEITNVQTPDASVPAGMKMVTLTAGIDAAETKTTYDADGKFSWTKGDQISVLASDNNYYTFTATETASSSTFTGALPQDVELGTYALYPASEVHYYDASSWQPYFGIDMYKDLTGKFSADLPMTAKKDENNSYSFKHATSALLFTFTNIPSNIVAVEISFENESLQFSGRHKAYYGEPWDLVFLEEGNLDDDRKFVRKVSVENNMAKVYLPFKGTLWNGYDNIINVLGYDTNGNEYILIENQLMPGKDKQLKTLRQVIPVKPLKVPVNVKNLDWNGTNAVTAYVDPSATYSRIKQMNVLSDSDNLYIRMVASLEAPFEGNYLDLFFCDGKGDVDLWADYWTTKCTSKYYYQHKGELDASGNITKMRFYTEPNEGGRVYVTTVTDIVGEEAYWYFTYPLTYLEQYKSVGGELYISAMLWKGWDAYGVIPTKDTEMLKVTLP